MFTCTVAKFVCKFVVLRAVPGRQLLVYLSFLWNVCPTWCGLHHV